MSSLDFTSFLKLMVQKKASDLFITAGIPPSLKVHGRIGPITQQPLTPQQSRDLVLNLPPITKTLAMTKRGLIMFVGATGTGKSTSLAAMIGYRNQNSTGHII